MGWVQILLAFAGVAIGYHFGTLNKHAPPTPYSAPPSHLFLPAALPPLSFALGSLSRTGQKRRFWEILLGFCISITYILKGTQRDQGFRHSTLEFKKTGRPPPSPTQQHGDQKWFARAALREQRWSEEERWKHGSHWP